MEQRVCERTHQLEVANQELEAFSYSVSHDLRAPLRSINGFNAALQEDYTEKLDDNGKHYLERVRTASKHMEQLIDDFLNLSRIMRTHLQRTTVNLSDLACFIAFRLQETQSERHVIFDITPGLIVQADKNLLEIALENLMGNVWKYTSKNTSEKIEVGIKYHDEKKVYYVCDDGDGFDMKYASKLFGAFQRMHTHTEFQGTGIGLATVRRIIHRPNGDIWADAQKGKGATFYFSLAE